MIRSHNWRQNHNGTSRQLDNLQRSSPLRVDWKFLSVSVSKLERNKERKKRKCPLGILDGMAITSLRDKGHQIWGSKTVLRGYRTVKSFNERLRRKRSLETPLSFVAGTVFPRKATIHLRRQRWIMTHHSVRLFASNRNYSK